MYVRLTYSKKAKHPVLQIVQGVREGKKVKQKIIASLGVIKDKKDLIKLSKLSEHLIKKLEQEGLPPENKIRIADLIHKNTTYDGFGLVVDKLMKMSGFSHVLQAAQGKKEFDLEEIVKLVIAQRFDLPSSKLRTFERQEEHGFQNIDLQHIYRCMDAIEPLSVNIQNEAFATVSTYSCAVDCLLFDVTTLYFESINQDELRDFGFNKDQKHHLVQIVLALVVNQEGVPIAYETFKGNLGETKTLIPVLDMLRKRFSIKNVTVVCDRGMASKGNAQALQKEEFNFVIAAKLRSMSKKLKINDLSTYSLLPNQENVPEEEKILFRVLEHPQYADTELIVTYSPRRAEKDKKDRERLIEKLINKLKSEDETSIKKVISNSGYKKYTNVKEGSLVTINQEAVDKDVAWDGFHGISVTKGANLSVTKALERYKELWRVEEAFRVAKCTLRTRPIFHWKPHRIRAHVLLCFMTLFFERFLELLLRRNSTPLTPDKIRHALGGVHTIYFEDGSSNREGKIESHLSEDAKKIFEALQMPVDRISMINQSCCV
jgi:transposase